MTYAQLKDLVFKENLAPGEFFHDPFYGMVDYRFNTGYAFFALTDKQVLISIVPEKGENEAMISLGIPFTEITHTEVQKRIFGQYTIDIDLANGNTCHIRVSKKLIGGRLDCQAESIEKFIETMEAFNN